MKKTFFFFVMLASVTASAQSHINIELLGATYTTPAVQFRVSWNSIPSVTGKTHNSKIWLWVDYVKIENNQPSGSRARATITNPSPGTVVVGNNNGFWLQGNNGSYNQIVTVALTNIPANTTFNWCAYASDCPPNVTAANGTYTFKGTPPFTLIASNGTTTQTVTGTTLAASALTITPTTIRDKTACPGVFCSYTGSDLYIDASHPCQLRTSGAQNWEAWIKDTRDNKMYRIAQLSTGLWTMDDYLNYTGHAAVVDEKCSAADPNAKEYWRHTLATTYSTLCPTGWRLPIITEIRTVAADWKQYLTKIFVATGETINSTSTHCQNISPNYISFIASDCLGRGVYGGRFDGYDTYAVNPTHRNCASYTSGAGVNYLYSGYVRCVRDL